MIEDLTGYPAYRDVPLPWAPRIPSHWATKRGKALLSESNLPVGDSSGIVTCFRDGQVTLRSNRRTRGFMTALYELGYQGVRCGQLVVHAMDAFAGAIGVSDSDGKCTPEYIVCNPRSPEMVPEYFALALRYAAHQDFIRLSCPAVRERAPRFRYPNLGDMQLPLPPRDEQAAIVRFLDHANRRIERFIRAKRKLIALLNEQKQAIIHRAVTRGLDPNVPMKDSGVPWLPSIPATWRSTRLKFEATHIVDCLHATPQYVSDGEFPAIRTADVEPGRLRLSQARRVSKAQFALFTSRLQPRDGDILYSREGERYGMAAAVPADVQLCISQRMMVFRIRSSQNAEYIMWQLNCPHVYAQASVHVIGSTSPHVNVEQIRNYQLVVPPAHEQLAICDSIRAENARLDAIVSRTQRELVLMREYRTRLIADVVTGQLDVREAAARLPAEETEPLDVPTELEDDELLDDIDTDATQDDAA